MLIDKRLQNRELNLREYELRLSTLKSRPRAVFAELTQNCNLRCFMCKPAGSLRQGYYPELDMPYPLFEQIAEALFPTAELVDLRGQGESTILRDFWRYFDRTISYGVRVRLVTNLTMTDPSVLEKLVANDALLAISMDAPNRELYEEIRKGSRYDVVIANLELLQSPSQSRPIERHAPVGTSVSSWACPDLAHGASGQQWG